MNNTNLPEPVGAKERGANVNFPPPLVFAAALVGGIVLRYTVGATPVPIAPVLRLVCGLAVMALGFGLVLSARLHFLRTRQSPIPWKPTPALIFDGPYRFTRNPMYLGITLFLVGLGAASSVLWISILAVPALAIVHYLAVLPEERYLSEKFGAAYAGFVERVPRYL